MHHSSTAHCLSRNWRAVGPYNGRHARVVLAERQVARAGLVSTVGTVGTVSTICGALSRTDLRAPAWKLVGSERIASAPRCRDLPLAKAVLHCIRSSSRAACQSTGEMPGVLEGSEGEVPSRGKPRRNPRESSSREEPSERTSWSRARGFSGPRAAAERAERHLLRPSSECSKARASRVWSAVRLEPVVPCRARSAAPSPNVPAPRFPHSGCRQ